MMAFQRPISASAHTTDKILVATFFATTERAYLGATLGDNVYHIHDLAC